MPTPAPIGRVRFTEARAVQVREAGDVKAVHSAVYGTVAVYTDTLTETQSLIDNWNEVMQAVNQKIVEIISRTREV